ncbi:GNAT family N-acetyltransferase [Mesobacterium sp. TK19101]|uniref:GNAT family N-acetyltransferase n=1 Tax=Mesobacterium hydrothermale TaxID=3111907 RepID=A0ABU6HG00_9RHOB|nr:GNAT family N-acetyltransferase [Mesobacterium sp. TK19101]MEC3860901.1 GNAT family N-acetyltransferase [Mesobacterium sp. TK19101]
MTPEALAALQARAYNDMAPWSAAAFEGLLRDPHVHLFESDAAFLLVRFVLDEAEILALATDPGHQRRGQASNLIRQLHDQAARAGIAQIFLEVAAPNTPAQAFYAHHGYALTGLRKGYFRQPDGTRTDALLMSRALT